MFGSVMLKSVRCWKLCHDTEKMGISMSNLHTWCKSRPLTVNVDIR